MKNKITCCKLHSLVPGSWTSLVFRLIDYPYLLLPIWESFKGFLNDINTLIRSAVINKKEFYISIGLAK